jgi:hypothetical protein
MTAPVTTGEAASSVAVTRPVAVRQVAAGLATAAALVAASGLGLSLDTVRYTSGSSDASITPLAWGPQISGSDISGGFLTVTWGGPLVLAVVLLALAAATALVGARTDRGPWAVLAQLLAIAGGALVAGVLGVLVPFGDSDVSTPHHVAGVTTTWGPVVGALGVAVALAAGAAVTARRGRPAVLATVQVNR